MVVSGKDMSSGLDTRQNAMIWSNIYAKQWRSWGEDCECESLLSKRGKSLLSRVIPSTPTHKH